MFNIKLMKKVQLMELKFDKYSVLMAGFIVMPLIDSVSGAFHEDFPIGQVYRVLLFVYMLVLLAQNAQKEFCYASSGYILFTVVQGIVGRAYLMESIKSVMKLYTPIVTILLFNCLIKKNKLSKKNIFTIMNIWTIAYPVLVLVPGILGYGRNAYEGSVGWKGFFYAVNEISFIMSSMVMYLFWKLSQEIKLTTIILLAMNCASIALMGTKTGYATIVLFFGIVIISFIKERNTKKKVRIVALITFGVMGMLLVLEKVQSLTAGILGRWQYQRGLSYSITDFLFSMRLRKLQDAVELFLNGNYFLVGWGLGNEQVGFPNLEMDFFDLLFKTGLLGFTIICFYYLMFFRKIYKKSIFGTLIVLWSIALSFGAGHVLFSGQSGMMLALTFIYVSQVNKKIWRKDICSKNGEN